MKVNMRAGMTIIIIVLTVAACASWDVELPDNDSGGADEMRPSPCVCLELDDYDGRGFRWHS